MKEFVTVSEFELIQRTAKVAKREGIPLRIVGGFVRDRLLLKENRLFGQPKQEIDFVTTGDAIGFSEKLASELPKARSYTYGHFGTARVDYAGWALEFATARTESYSPDSRNPSVEAADFLQDAVRRDFTVNALSWGLTGDETGQLIDPFNCLRDLAEGLLRTCDDPVKTFTDDPLRMLRAARFAAKLDFQTTPETFAGIRDCAERIKIVHMERIADEFLQLMKSAKPQIGLRLLIDTGVMQILIPEIMVMDGVDQRGRHGHKDVLAHTLQVVENASALSDEIVVRLAALFHDIAKPQTKKYLAGTGWTFYGHEILGGKMIDRIFRRLKLPNTLAKQVGSITRLHMRPVRLAQEGVTDSAVRRLRVEAGDDLERLLKLCRADITSANPKKVETYLANYKQMLERLDIVDKRDHLSAFQSPVRGEDIAKICEIPFGPRIGMIKTAIEEAILDGEIPNEYEAARDWLLTHRESLLQQPEQRVRKRALEQLDEEQLHRLIDLTREDNGTDIESN